MLSILLYTYLSSRCLILLLQTARTIYRRSPLHVRYGIYAPGIIQFVGIFPCEKYTCFAIISRSLPLARSLASFPIPPYPLLLIVGSNSIRYVSIFANLRSYRIDKESKRPISCNPRCDVENLIFNIYSTVNIV